MYNDYAVECCQREIRRLRSVVRELESQIDAIKDLYEKAVNLDELEKGLKELLYN